MIVAKLVICLEVVTSIYRKSRFKQRCNERNMSVTQGASWMPSWISWNAFLLYFM